MKGTLNIYRDNFLEKEELTRLINFIRDNPALYLFTANTQTFGIIQQASPLSIDTAFKIEAGTNSNTIKMSIDSYALDVNGNLIYCKAFDNLLIPSTDETWYWVKISHRYDNYEEGFVDIATDGTLSGTGTAFTEVLRGASSGFPTKIRLYSQDPDTGELTPATNSGIYEVVSVESDNTAILAGSFTTEQNLRYVVLGAFSIATSVNDISSEGIYSYDSCQIEFIEEEEEDVPPSTGFVTNEHFYIARVKSDGVTVTIQNKRTNYYFRLNFGDIVVTNKANVDASNLSGTDISAWLSVLSLYTQSQIDTALTAFLTKSQNLNDLDSKSTARDNLEVYSKTYVDNYYPLYTKVIEIGNWNMNVQSMNSVAHGLTYDKIRSVAVTIRNDADDHRYSLDTADSSSGVVYGGWVVDTTTIIMTRQNSGFFDSILFEATPYNRGWIIIQYAP